MPPALRYRGVQAEELVCVERVYGLEGSAPTNVFLWYLAKYLLDTIK